MHWKNSQFKVCPTISQIIDLFFNFIVLQIHIMHTPIDAHHTQCTYHICTHHIHAYAHTHMLPLISAYITHTHTHIRMDEYNLLSLFSAASFSVVTADHYLSFQGACCRRRWILLSHQPMFSCCSPFRAGLVPSSMIFGSSFQGALQLMSDKIQESSLELSKY